MFLGELFGKAIVGAIARKVVDAGISGVSHQPSTNDVEKALEVALRKAQSQAGELVPSLNADDQAKVEDFLTAFLGSGIGLEELRKGSEKPDAGVLLIAFEKLAKTTPRLESMEKPHLEKWLGFFVETYFEQTNTFIRYRAKLREYLDRLITSCEDVKFVGIDVSAREDHRAARLLDIFVVPNVSEESAKSASIPERLLLERPEQLTERQAELWMEQRDRHFQERGRSLSAHEMLGASRRRVVLLGDPGTGKTTLMRYLAAKAAGSKRVDIGLPEGQERLPILVYMRDWAKHPERSLLDQVRDFAENTLQVELPTVFLEHWMDGQALLLLDGLDEVAEDATRADLVQKINCFLAAHEQNWAVITSRPWGYRRDYFRTEDYPHFELELFDDGQVQEFIEHWYLNRCDNNTTQAQEMIRDLQDALKSKDRLQNLVKNPLLLTMVALIHRYQDTLPKRRHKLYDRAVDTLLKSWDRKGKGEIYGEFKHLDRDDDLRRVMSQLAYWIHTQYETQTTESGTLIEEEDLLIQLSQIIRREYPQVKPHQAKEEAERFVAFIRDRTGLLNEYGRGRYAFVHKTFQEYLTAEAILNQAKYDDDPEIILQTLRDKLHSPHWREVLLLLVGQRQGKGAANAIEEILRQSSPYEQWLHLDLLFAGRCLTEDPEKLATAAPNIISEILQRLVALETKNAELVGRKVKQETFEILSCLKETAFETEALANLKLAQNEIEQCRLLELQAKLGEKEIALTTLLQMLRDEVSSVRYGAANALVNLGDNSELVISGLLALFNDEDPWVYFSAADALVKLGNRSELAISELLALLNNEDSNVRLSAVSPLGNLGNRSELVISELLALLNDEDSNVCLSAADALVKLGDRSELVISKLLSLLNDEDSLMRLSAADALVKLGDRSELVISELLSLLKDEDSNVCLSAADALVKLGDRSELVISGLLPLLKGQDSFVCFSAANVLVKLGNRSELVISRLFALLKDEDSFVCLSAADTLVNLGDHSELLILGLLPLLNDEEQYIRSRAADALGKLGERSELVISNLLTLLKDEDSFVGSSAANALGELGKSDPEFQAVLAQWIEQHSGLPNIGSAIDALWQICA
jgi:HEAT repeat protein